MRSPVNKAAELSEETLEGGLKVYRCPQSNGIYIALEDYWKWQHTQPKNDTPEQEDAPESPCSEFDDMVKICPESGTLMTRYRVGHGLDFRVDRSVTGGVWLDEGEWEALKNGGIHRNLHKIFTAPWQKAIRDSEFTKQHEQRLQNKLGAELYNKLTGLKSELAHHPNQAEALAYLIEDLRSRE